MVQKIDLANLDGVINSTLEQLEKGKGQISEIAESARQERDHVKKQLNKIKEDTLEVIDEVDRIEKEELKSRRHLMDVSRNFDKYNEEDVKDAYNKAREIQLQLGLMRERESQFRARRDQLEFSLRRLNDTVEKAEGLVSKVGVALNFLMGNLMGIGVELEKMQQKQQLGLRIIKAQEEERRRVAREIHDGPAQSMANVVLRVEICEKLLEKKPEAVKGELSELKGLVKNSMRDVRKIIFDLRPMVLDDLGIVPALKRYFAEFEEKSPILIEFRFTGSINERVNSALEVAIFRIIQETLNNAHKHSNAKNFTVHLEQTKSNINLRIRDDGSGFELEKVLKDNKSSTDSYGLIGIRERIDILDGNLKIKTALGKGTEFRISIPITDPNKGEDKDEGNINSPSR